MKRRTGNYMAKAAALAASLALVVGLMPAPALATASDGSQASRTPATSVLRAQTDSASDVRISGTDLIQKLITAAAVGVIDPEEAATMGAEWAAELFCEEVLGIKIGGSDEAALKEILAGIEELSQELNTLQRTVNNQELNQILNSLIPLLSKQTTSDVYTALSRIDSNSSTPEQKKQLRMSAVTDDLGIDEAHCQWQSGSGCEDHTRFRIGSHRDFAWRSRATRDWH